MQESNFSVFFYDDKGELVACSFLRPILSDEDEESAAEILAIIAAEVELENNITADSMSSEIEDALSNNSGNEATPIDIDDGGNNAGSLMFSFLPIVVFAAACVFLA